MNLPSTFTLNGMLKTNEIAGEGNSFSTEFRQYDPRLGKWLSLDPLMDQFPWMSPFVGMDNNPIYFTDPYGLNTIEGDKGGQDFTYKQGGEDPKPRDSGGSNKNANKKGGRVYVYNVWTDAKGKVRKKLSHMYRDKNLKGWINQTNTYYGGKVPGDVTFTDKHGRTIYKEIKDGNDENLKTTKAVTDYFNTDGESKPTTTAATSTTLDNMGSYGELEGDRGLYQTADNMDELGDDFQYIPILSQVGEVIQYGADGLRTIGDLRTKSNEEAIKRLVVRIGFSIVDKKTSKIIENTKRLSKSHKYIHGQRIRNVTSKLKEETLENIENK